MRQLIFLLGCVLFGGCAASDELAVPDSPPGAQAVSFLGDSLFPPAPAAEIKAERERELEEAFERLAKAPSDAYATIWFGRRLAYLGYYQEAISVYTDGIAEHPEDARFLRHRGHRYVTTRNLDSAVEDLARAAKLVQGKPDEIEPDGLPNPKGIPTSTLQSNIWYHLGLAHYLKGDFERALSSYKEDLKVTSNPDMLVATSHWLYMTLRRLGRPDEAAEVLDAIHADMDIIENHSYHKLLLMYKEEIPVDELLEEARGDDALQNATIAYGIGNWFLYNGEEERAREIFQEILTEPQWAAFGYIAAEAEVGR